MNLLNNAQLDHKNIMTQQLLAHHTINR